MVSKNISLNHFLTYFLLERTIVVSQHCGKPLSNFIGKEKFDLNNVLKIAYQILNGFNELHKQYIIHRNLSPDNILIQANDCDLKLFDYGLYHMAGEGSLISFSIMCVLLI